MMQAPSSHIRLLGAFFVFQELFLLYPCWYYCKNSRKTRSQDVDHADNQGASNHP